MGQRDEKVPSEASWPELEEIYWPAKWTRANPEDGHNEEEGYDVISLLIIIFVVLSLITPNP